MKARRCARWSRSDERLRARQRVAQVLEREPEEPLPGLVRGQAAALRVPRRAAGRGRGGGGNGSDVPPPPPPRGAVLRPCRGCVWGKSGAASAQHLQSLLFG